MTQTSSTISFNSLSDIRSPIRRRTVPSSCQYRQWLMICDPQVSICFSFYYWLLHQYSQMLFFVGIDFLYQHSGPSIGACRISKRKIHQNLSKLSLAKERDRSKKSDVLQILDTEHPNRILDTKFVEAINLKYFSFTFDFGHFVPFVGTGHWTSQNSWNQDVDVFFLKLKMRSIDLTCFCF